MWVQDWDRIESTPLVEPYMLPIEKEWLAQRRSRV